LALPIGSTTIKMNDLLTSLGSSDFIHQTNSGLLYILYDQKVKATTGEDNVPVPLQQSVFVPSIALPPTFPISGIVSKNVLLPLPVSFSADQKIDSILLKRFIINISGSSTYPQDGKLVLTFSSITKKGKAYSDTIPIPHNDATIDFSTPNNALGYTMNFASGSSSLPIDVNFILQGNAGSAVGPGNLNLSLKVNELHYFILYGYLGKNNLLNATDSLDVSFLNTNLANNIEWADPQLTYTIKNSYGLPIKFRIDSMKVNSVINKKIYPISFNNTDSNVIHIAPSIQIGTYTSDSIVFDHSTTDFFTYLQKAPNSIKYHLSAISNPDGNVGGAAKNSMQDTSKIEPEMHFKLPIWFKGTNLGTIDTMAFPLSSFFNSQGSDNSIESMLFRIISENTLPIDMNLQIVFADTTYKPIDSLYKTNNGKKIVIGGQLDAGDIVKTPSMSKTDITLNANDTTQLDALKKTKFLLVKMNLTTSDYNKGIYAKFLSKYYMTLSFECQFQLKVQKTLK
jgi:hypothetical protein